MNNSHSDTLVFFGATGDLAYKKIFPALQAMVKRGNLNVPVIGVSRGGWNLDRLKIRAKDSLEKHGGLDPAAFEKLCGLLRYVDGDYNDVATFQTLRKKMGNAKSPAHYLAIPPAAFAMVVKQLTAAHCAMNARVILEKPFGRDRLSAQELNQILLRSFDEKAIFRMMDHLYRRGTHVHYDDGSKPPVHVSGHGSIEELRLMLNLVRPKYFVPIHGEYRQLARHKEVAEEGNAVSGGTFLLESGDALEFDAAGARLGERVPVGHVYLDTGSLDEVGEVLLKERRRISEDGIVVPVLAINKHTGRLEAPPEIVSRGLVALEGAADLIESAREVVLRTIDKSNPEEAGDWGVVKDKIRSSLRKFFDQELGKRPMILPVVLEV